MRILHILDHSIPLHSGYTFRTRAILEQQRLLGWETEHITGPKHGQAAHSDVLEETVDGLHFYRTRRPVDVWGRLPVLGQWSVMRALAKRLEAVARQVKPDILHAHSPALNGSAALSVGRRLGIPVVYEVRAFWEDAAVDHGTSTEWGLRYRLTRLLETRVLRGAGAVTTICEGLRNEIIGRGIAPTKVTVIPNAVDIQRFAAAGQADAELAAQLGLSGQTVLGFIGSFYAYEGLTLLVAALPLILHERPDVRLLLVGGGPQAEQLKRMVSEHKLDEVVRFTGRVPHDQVQRFYGQVDILVYPRLSMRLTELVTPLKPLEAMAQGKLVVGSDVGGHRELIRSGETGWLFKAGDPKALADAVLMLLDRREQWPAIQAAGRRFVEQERSWPASVARYRPVYEAVLGKR